MSSMRPVPAFIITLLVFAVISYLVVRNRHPTPPQTKVPPVAESPAVKERRAALAKRAGLKRGYVRHDDKNVQLEVTVHVLRRCTGGDLDIINLDLAHSKAKKLLLTVESVSPEMKFEPRVFAVSPEMINAGFTHTFEFPRGTGTQSLALYLCKNSDGSGRCAGKQMARYNALFQEYALNEYPPTWLGAPDRIYFFQFVHLRDGEELTVFSEGRVPDDNFAALPDFLKSDAEPDESARAAETTTRVKNLTRGIGSLPLDFGTNITMELPKSDIASCEIPLPGALKK